jgi:transposase
MDIVAILNKCYKHKSFIYTKARFGKSDSNVIEVLIEARTNAKPLCSVCGKRCPGYDRLSERKYEFIPIWGYHVFFLYARRRVQCRTCGIVAEQLPWSDGKHQLTKAYMQFLANWAKKLSWKDVAVSFGTSWEKVFHSVEYVVEWGLEHRDLSGITAIGVDEI